MFFRRKRRGPDDAARQARDQSELDHEAKLQGSAGESGELSGNERSAALTDRADAYEMEGLHDRAIENYDAAIKLEPGLARAYCGRATAYARMGRLRKAAKDLDKAIRLKPDYVEAIHIRGLVHEKRGHHDQALEDQNHAIELDPGYAEAYRRRGLLYLNSRHDDLAIEDFCTAIRLEPDDEVAYCNRGIALARKGLHQQAIEDYTNANRLNPNDPFALANRGLLQLSMLQEGQLLEGSWRAMEDLWKAHQLWPDNPELGKMIDELRPLIDGARIPGGTLADPQLQRDALLNICFVAGFHSMPSSDSDNSPIRVVDTKVLEPPRDLRKGWVEQWTVRRDGDQADYRVEYMGDGRGGYFIKSEDKSGNATTAPMPRGLPPFD